MCIYKKVWIPSPRPPSHTSTLLLFPIASGTAVFCSKFRFGKHQMGLIESENTNTTTFRSLSSIYYRHYSFDPQAIYACHGGEPPPIQFPNATGVHAISSGGANTGTHGDACAGGGDDQSRILSHLPQIGAVAGGSTGEVERGPPQRWIDNGDSNPSSSSQAASNLFYLPGEGGRSGEGQVGAGAGRSPAGNAAFPGRTVGVADGVADSVAGGPRGEVEFINSIFWPHPYSTSLDRDKADGSVNSSTGGMFMDRALPTSETSSDVGAGSSTGGSSSLSLSSSSAATSAVMGRAPKLVDFFNLNNEGSSRQFRAARDYLAEFREFNLDRAILQEGLGATGERIAALDLPLVARYTFQVISTPVLVPFVAVDHRALFPHANRLSWQRFVFSRFPLAICSAATTICSQVSIQGLCHALCSSTHPVPEPQAFSLTLTPRRHVSSNR